MTKTELELAIDRHGLCAILEAMAEICSDKAQHIQENAESRYVSALATDWSKAGYFIAGASAKVDQFAHGAQAGHDKNHTLAA